MNPSLQILEGNITTLGVDSIVNTAHETLLGSGGRAAGRMPQAGLLGER